MPSEPAADDHHDDEPDDEQRLDDEEQRLPERWFVVPLVAFLASRLLVLVAAFAVRYIEPGTLGVLYVFTDRADSGWYLDIARLGYPSEIPDGYGITAQTRIGFFPLFPLLTRGVSEVLRVDLPVAAVILNFVAAAVATVLVWLLAHRLLGRVVADRASFFFAFFPGAYALSLAYSEAVYLAFAAGCLLLLEQRRWWWAALVGGIGSAGRPTGYALALACAFAAAMHRRRTRDWKPLLTPVLAAGGLLAFMLYLEAHTGDFLAYQHQQERGWGQGIDGGRATVRRFLDFLATPDHDLNLVVPLLAVVAAAALLLLVVRARLPGTLAVYTVASLLPGLLTRGIALTPRHLLVGFPVVIAAAKGRTETGYAALLALFAGGLMLLTLLTGGTALTP